MTVKTKIAADATTIFRVAKETEQARFAQTEEVVILLDMNCVLHHRGFSRKRLPYYSRLQLRYFDRLTVIKT